MGCNAMLNSKLVEILDILLQEKIITGHMLCEKLGISDKTCRNRIKELNEELNIVDAKILAQKGKGYKLIISNRVKFDEWYDDRIKTARESVPQFAGERVSFLLFYLLNQQDYVRREDMCMMLFVSEKTISVDIKQIEDILGQYNLKLEKRASYGIKVQGHEFQKRQCILNYFYRQKNNWYVYDSNYKSEFQEIKKIIMQMEKVHLTESGLASLAGYIVVMKHRIKHGFLVEKDETLEKEPYFDVSMMLMEELVRSGQIPEVNEWETFYIMLYLKGNRLYDSSGYEIDNFVIPSYINEIVSKVISAFYSNYNIDFRTNLNFRMAMCNHFVTMDVRLRYGIHLENPILDEVKRKYVQEYLLAQQTCTIISEEYGVPLSEDEIGFIALIIKMYSEERKSSQIRKNRVLLVCATGNVTSKYLQYILEKEFNDFIQDLYVCGLSDVSNFNFEKVDYVFSTIPINVSVPVPIMQISDVINDFEIKNLKQKVNYQKHIFLRDFYSKAAFFKDLEGNTWEEVIYNLCQKIKEIADVPDNFYQSVMQREQLGNTDLGYMSALPHPYQLITEKSIAVVAILKKPIFWSQREVQLVILSSLSKGEQKNNRLFFECTINFVTDEEKVKKVLKEKNFEVFMEQICG